MEVGNLKHVTHDQSVVRSRGRASDNSDPTTAFRASSRAPSSTADASTSSGSTTREIVPHRQEPSETKREFKRLARMYMQRRAPPTLQDMIKFQGMKGTYDWTDILRWCEEVGLVQGVLYDDDTGAVEFLDFPLEPHEALKFEFNTRFSKEFLLPWMGTPVHPVFEGLGSSSKASQHHFVSKANVVDFWYPGRKKTPDASFRPYPRPNPAMLKCCSGAHATTICQTLADHPFGGRNLAAGTGYRHYQKQRTRSSDAG